jgi:5-hydroxyisourate hydrolase-like protein (transthyretin family)
MKLRIRAGMSWSQELHNLKLKAIQLKDSHVGPVSEKAAAVFKAVDELVSSIDLLETTERSRIKANLRKAEEDENGAYKLHSKVVMDGITYEVIKKYREFGRYGSEFVYDLKDPEGVVVKNVGHKEIR